MIAFKFVVTVFAICGFLLFLTMLYDRHISYPCEQPYSSQCIPEENIERINESRRQYRFNVRVGETTSISIFTLLDNGILLNANVMRPLLKPPLPYDNRPFVARQIVAGMLGLLLYAGATWLILWFVEDDKPPEIA